MVSLAFITVILEFKITGRVKMNIQTLSTTVSFLDKIHCLLINMPPSVMFIMHVEEVTALLTYAEVKTTYGSMSVLLSQYQRDWVDPQGELTYSATQCLPISV